MTSRALRNTRPMPKPESGGIRSRVMANKMKPHIPAKIKDPIPPATNPGGPDTPGAKQKRKQEAK